MLYMHKLKHDSINLFTMAQQPLHPSSGSRPPHNRGFMITNNDAPQSVGLLWTSDQPEVETST